MGTGKRGVFVYRLPACATLVLPRPAASLSQPASLHTESHPGNHLLLHLAMLLMQSQVPRSQLPSGVHAIVQTTHKQAKVD